MYIYIYIHRTLSALNHDYLATLEPGTRSRIPTRFMGPGDETSRGISQAGRRSPRLSDDVCADLLRLEDSLETRGVLSSGAGASENGTFGRWHR